MISDLSGSLGSRQFLKVANESTCLASCACTFKSIGLFTLLKRTKKTDLKVTYVFVTFE